MILNKQFESLHILASENFTPHQPYLEHNNQYYSYKPDIDDSLYGIVWEVYQVNMFDSSKLIAFPDICADFMVFYSDSKARCYLMEGTKELRSMTDLNFISEIKTIFGVRFCSGSIGELFCSGVRDLGNSIVEADCAFIDGEDTISQLSEAKTFKERWYIVRNYLEKRLQCENYKNQLTKYVLKTVINNHGSIRIKSLEEKTGYTNRYINKKINESIGVSVKKFCEIVQFHWSYQLFHNENRSISLSELAIESGYYDQSHMNLSYKRLTGNLPSNILNIYI